MPDDLTNLLMAYRDTLWLAFMGLMGAVVRLALGVDHGTPLTPSLVVATLLSGTVFASVGSSFISALVSLPAGATGFSGFVCGLVGVAVATLFVNKTFKLPGDKENGQ